MKPTELIQKSKTIATWMGYKYWEKREVEDVKMILPTDIQYRMVAYSRSKGVDVPDPQPIVLGTEKRIEPRGWYGSTRLFQPVKHLGVTIYDLAFHSDWSKLMQVVERIENCVYPHDPEEAAVRIPTIIAPTHVLIDKCAMSMDKAYHENSKILMVFDAVAQFCEKELAKPEEERFKPKPFVIKRSDRDTPDPV